MPTYLRLQRVSEAGGIEMLPGSHAKAYRSSTMSLVITNFTQYVEFARQTAAEGPLDTSLEAFHLLHGAVGLVDELGELQEAIGGLSERDELGDCWWYLAMIAFAIRAQDIEWGRAPALDSLQAVHEAKRWAFAILPLAKKTYFQGKSINRKRIRFYVEQVGSYLQAIDPAVEHVWVQNIEKLHERYSGGGDARRNES